MNHFAAILFSNLRIAILALLISHTQTACHAQKKTPVHNKTAFEKTDRGTVIVSAPLVKKKYVTKKGIVTTREEWYVQLSVQDYFIKFSESTVSRKELEARWAALTSTTKAMKLEIAFKEGSWDHVSGMVMAEERIGKYVVVHRILK